MTGWAEERLCETWKSDFDPEHPASVDAAGLEKRNASSLDVARQEDTGRLETPPVSSDSLAKKMLARLRRKLHSGG
ncbi:hypothetical protein [Alkalilacustris brevis]|uniref:hypothetical protein n=1 Tax=Alkalilacustris brevis TaxID=2026338 RepID=UPI0012D305A1|nr:hypothetical protein [Alkalilacustris brevis]